MDLIIYFQIKNLQVPENEQYHMQFCEQFVLMWVHNTHYCQQNTEHMPCHIRTNVVCRNHLVGHLNSEEKLCAHYSI